MKKIFVSAVFALSFVAAAPAQAAQEIDFVNFYTVADNLSTTAKSVFGLDETPWLYAKLPAQYYNATQWKSSAFAAFDFTGDGNSSFDAIASQNGNQTKREFWLTPSDWDSVKEIGEWRITGFYELLDQNCYLKQWGQGVTNFTVTPEPASMLLFGLGAGALGLAGLKRKRK